MAELDWLMHQAKRYPLLTAEQEIELAREVQAWLPIRDKPNLSKEEMAIVRRGKKAHDRFLMSNIAMVVKLANRYNHSHIAGSLTLDDLVQEGIFGLQRAIEMFDPTRGYKFSTYAFNWIRQCISRGVERRSQLIYLPCSAHDMIRKARRYMREQEQLHGKTPKISAVAEALGFPDDQLRKALEYNQKVFSLDEPATSQTGRKTPSTLVETLASNGPGPSAVAELENVLEAMPRILSTLPPEQREVICRRYFKDKPDTYDAIAKDFGVSRERIRQVHDKTIKMLRLKFGAVATPEDIQAIQCA